MNTKTKQKTKDMKTGFRIVLILFLSVMAIKAGANTTKAISEQDSNIIIIHKAMVDNNFDNFNTDSSLGHTFATMPDTTVDIIIIYRRIYQGNFINAGPCNQKSTYAGKLLPVIYLKEGSTNQIADLDTYKNKIFFGPITTMVNNFNYV